MICGQRTSGHGTHDMQRTANCLAIAIGSLGLLVIAALLDASRTCLFFSSTKRVVRAQLIEAYKAVPIGAEISSLKQTLGRSNLLDYGIRFYAENPEQLELRAPTEFPRLTWSWIVYFFTDGEHVTGKAIRPVDGDFPLCEAPPDEGLFPSEMRLDAASKCIK